MDPLGSAVVKAQVLGEEGDEAFYKGNWVLAAEKYIAAAGHCSEGLKNTVDPQQSKEILEKLLSRYSEKAQQIQEYLKTPHIQQMSLAGSALSDSYMPFGNLLHGEDSSHEFIENPSKPQGTVTSILRGLESFITRFIYAPQPVPQPTQEPDIENSFILLPATNEKEEKVTLNDSNAMSKLTEEIKELQIMNQLLKEENQKLQEASRSTPAIHELLQENTNLRKSFMIFRKQVQDYASSQYNTAPLPAQRLDPLEKRTSPKTPNRILELEENIRLLHQKLAEKDTQIKDLEEYKTKWEKLKQDARQRRKLKEPTPETSNSSGVWTSDTPTTEKNFETD